MLVHLPLKTKKQQVPVHPTCAELFCSYTGKPKDKLATVTDTKKHLEISLPWRTFLKRMPAQFTLTALLQNLTPEPNFMLFR